MILFHSTNNNSINKILNNNELVSSAISGNLCNGHGIYNSDDNNFIYFSTVDDHNEKYMYQESITLFFESDLLFNRSFFVSTVQSGIPQYESKWNSGKSGKSEYKIKYAQYTSGITKILKKLFMRDIVQNNSEKIFFQNQVAIKNRCSLKKLFMIYFDSEPSVKTMKILKTQYPNVKIIIKY